MRSKAYLTTITALFVTFGVIGLVETVGATPDDSQRLRGLGDRVFLVNVELTFDPLGFFSPLPEGTTFPNCYIFAAESDADGNNWFETAFPDTKGTWTQGSVGAKTGYVVDLGFPFAQMGQVTPAHGKGVLQLEAETSIPEVIAFFSVGEEIDESEMGDRCPTTFIPTIPDAD